MTQDRKKVFTGDDSSACFIAGVLMGNGIAAKLELSGTPAVGRTVVTVPAEDFERAQRIRHSSAASAFGRVAAEPIEHELQEKRDFRFRVRVHGGPPDTPNRDDIEGLVDRVGLLEVVQALADVARAKADRMDDDIEASVRRGEVELTRERRARDRMRTSHFLLEDAAGRIRRGFA